MSTHIRTYMVLILVSLSMALSMVAKAQVHVCAPMETMQMASVSADSSGHQGHNEYDTDDEHSNHQMTAASDIKPHDHSKMPCCDENSDTAMQASMQNHSPCSDCDMQSCGSSSAMLTVSVLSIAAIDEVFYFEHLFQSPSKPAKEWLKPPIA
ncbi:hypothetical protein [Thalassotalea sp. PS06]|uniref:hypothetical protein n=1 Tax=Thalassotalea sp. PS06 TaxID=2594005 RepID=UPI001162F5DE|nr:hypothetical protein [Thalassotalea sp. PS06]QDP02807.1 hypothetical protein FNC98_16545 [Thalassotalea sp. PS06]